MRSVLNPGLERALEHRAHAEPVRREGFWCSAREPDLPVPVACLTEWLQRERFASELTALERGLKPVLFRGYSMCRVCGCRNGSAQYEHRGWAWPEGFMHYVTDHLVRPSLAFEEFVLGEPLRELPDGSAERGGAHGRRDHRG